MDIKRVQGSKDVSLLECVNPRRNKWRIRWDVKTDADGVTTMPNVSSVANLPLRMCASS